MGKRIYFLLGFAAALGLLAALAVVAAGGDATASQDDGLASTAVPSREPLAVFDRARAARDSLPPSLVDEARELEGDASLPEEVQNGSMVVTQSRLLLDGVGSFGIDVYVFPSTKGRTCYLMTKFGGGCTAPFTVDQPVNMSIFDPDGLGNGVPVTIMGLVPNNVESVDVHTAGIEHRALVTNNAYFFQAPSPTAEIEKIVVYFSSGASRGIAIPALVNKALGGG